MTIPLADPFIIIGMLEFEKFSLGLAIASSAALLLVCLIGGTQSRINKHRLSEKYRMIYRVISAPHSNQFQMRASGASIEVGDYGWEAEPIHRDGLIYLHGLNPRWQVVWYAGLQPEQVQIVGPKPCSQYYKFPFWINEKKISSCPFSVNKYQFGLYPTFHFGFPVAIAKDWVQGRYISRRE